MARGKKTVNLEVHGGDIVTLDDARRQVMGLTDPGSADAVEPDPLNDPGLLEDDPDFERPDEALGEVLASLGEVESRAAKCNIYRILSNNDEEYLYQATAAEFARANGLENVRAKYGGGDYRIRVYKDGKILTHKRVKIGAPLVPDTPAANSETAQLRSEIGEVKSALTQALQALTNRAPEKSMLDQIREAKELITLLSPAQSSPPVSAISQLKDMKDLLEIAREFSGDAEGKGGGILKIAEKYLPQVLDTVKEMGKLKGGAAGAPDDSESLALPAAQSQPVQSREDQMNIAQKMQLKMALGFLVSSAEADNEALTYAELSVDKVPAPVLVELLDRADWEAALCSIDARVASHQKWFTELRAEILKILREAGVTLKTPADPATLTPEETQGGAAAQ